MLQLSGFHCMAYTPTCTGAPTDDTNTRILQTILSGIPLVLGLSLSTRV